MTAKTKTKTKLLNFDETSQHHTKTKTKLLKFDERSQHHDRLRFILNILQTCCCMETWNFPSIPRHFDSIKYFLGLLSPRDPHLIPWALLSAQWEESKAGKRIKGNKMDFSAAAGSFRWGKKIFLEYWLENCGCKLSSDE